MLNPLYPVLIGAGHVIAQRLYEQKDDIHKRTTELAKAHRKETMKLSYALKTLAKSLEHIDITDPVSTVRTVSVRIANMLEEAIEPKLRVAESVPGPQEILLQVINNAPEVGGTKIYATYGKLPFTYDDTALDQNACLLERFDGGPIQSPEVKAMLERYRLDALPTSGFVGTIAFIDDPQAKVLQGIALGCGLCFQCEILDAFSQGSAVYRGLDGRRMLKMFMVKQLELTSEGRDRDVSTVGLGETLPVPDSWRLSLSPPILDTTVSTPTHAQVYAHWDARLQHDEKLSVLVQGPPGGGKTSGVLRYLQSRGRPYILLSATLGPILGHVVRLKDYDVVLDDVDRVSPELMQSLLFWLGKRSRAVWMTCNNFQRMPAAVRRPGRVSQVMLWPELSSGDLEVLWEMRGLQLPIPAHHQDRLATILERTHMAGACVYMDLVQSMGESVVLPKHDITFEQPPSLDDYEVYDPIQRIERVARRRKRWTHP